MTPPAAIARPAYVVLLALLGLALLIQVFFAGEAAILAPEEWKLHLAWVGIFQWLSLPLPVAAHVAGRKLWFTALNLLPIVLIGLQYTLIHTALARSDAVFAGLHAVGGVLLFGVVVGLAQEWRYRVANRPSGR